LRVAVASGKGGTGKTTVAVNLALSLGGAQLLDCDVEEPNAYLLLKPETDETSPVEIPVPMIDPPLCNYCGDCARFCQYHALFVAGETALVFPELCHGCGGCTIVCPRHAITETMRRIGTIHHGEAMGVDLVYGELDVGEPITVPIIDAVKRRGRDGGWVIIDSPPGAACPMVEAVTGSDACVLVTEPTPFGLHDLRIAVETVTTLGVPVAVIVNFAGQGDRGVYDFCGEKSLPIIMEIPFDREIAKLYSRGIPFAAEMSEWKMRFRELAERLEALI